MTVPVLLNALQIAWVSLIRDESITDCNISTAPLTLVAAVLEAATEGEQDEQTQIVLRGVSFNVATEAASNYF